MVVLENLVYKNKKWGKGTAYNPEREKRFKIKAWMNKKDELMIRGYWGFFYDTET